MMDIGAFRDPVVVSGDVAGDRDDTGAEHDHLALVSATDGRRAGFMTVGGGTLGLAIIGAIAAFGVAEAIQASDILFGILRWAGVLFLLYLAWDGWKSVAVTTAPEEEGR